MEGIYPYCGNRYKENPSGTLPSPTKGKAVNSCAVAHGKDGNPHCLNFMGQEQWEKEDAFDKFFTSFDKKIDPEVSRRKPNSPAGMKNLGATCYANSLLQVWFHDLPFRDAIYRSRFRIDVDKSLDALYQLQYLFAHLDCGIKNIYNPLSLVTSLKLDTNMQQDAQEFCNLFMARIDNQLQSQEDIFLKTFIKNQFQGHYSYITTCKKCKNSSVRDCTFYELILNIKENCTLMDCIDEFVEAEDLVGSDRYSCSHCQSLQDATREIRLGELPKVLTIQLMRFVYDTMTWTKKKSMDVIRFPETIDFAELLGSQSAVLYDLSAVLVHSGPSAHSGHFMAHVLDKSSNKWFVLNDEEVTEFDSTQFDPHDYTDTGSKPKAKNATMKAGAPDAERVWNTLSSRNAYMLTYTRRTSAPLVTPRRPPSETLDLVTADNATFEEELKEYTEFKEKVKTKFDQTRQVRRKLTRCWDVNNDEDESCYVSAVALSKYMQIDGDHTTTDGSNPEVPGIIDLDCSAVTCEHRKLCPTAVSRSKRISMDAKHILTEQGVKIDPVLTPMDVCEDCTRNLFQDKLYGLAHKDDVDAFEKLSKRRPSPPAVWISKSWLTAWKKTCPEFHQPHTSTTDDPGPLSALYLPDVLCPHSRLGADKSRRKVINMLCLEKLTAIFGPMGLPEYDTPECETCLELRQPPFNESIKELIATAASEKKELSGMRTRGSPDKILVGHRYYAVSKEFMEKWQNFVKDPANNERPAMIDNSDLLCKHDLFLFDFGNAVDQKNNEDIALIGEYNWSYLHAIYDGGPEIVIMKQEHMETDGGFEQSDALSIVQSTPALCPECRDERVLDFSTTALTIRVHAPGVSSVDEKAPASPESADISQASTPSKGSPSLSTFKNANSKRQQASAAYTTGTRQSKRIKESRNPYKEIVILDIRKEDTVMDLKKKIMAKENIFPLCQKLLYGQVELGEDEETVADLAIPPKAVLDVFRLDQGMDDIDLDKFHDDIPAPGDVGGFSGTGLTEEWF
ncbi:hypothetical protein BGZ95_010961 [Linnemannia exigua]|uniref:ubiquitinyl hydrolase 1 n=1 Tax=Linnemannia exigua TaxID=604196 RepID=A0AAD4DAP5_9FUNG|nr:hypothetical protein BGZ95_010961 [Linnemannia exigua]